VLLPPFELHRPTSLDSALALKAELGEQATWLAGGTDLIPNYKWRMESKPHVIALAKVAELQHREPSRIGAGVRLCEIERDAGVLSEIRAVAATIATPLLRNSGTVGGNLMLDTRCHWVNQSEFWRHSRGFCLKADAGPVCRVVPGLERCVATYSGDLAPLLMVLGAQVVVARSGGERELALSELFVEDGIRRHVLGPDELLKEILIPGPEEGWAFGYDKLRLRGTMDFPSAGVALAVRTEGRQVRDLRAAHTAIASAPEDFSESLGELIGAPVNRATAERLQELVEDQARPYKTVPLPPSYRRTWIGIAARKLFSTLCGVGSEPGPRPIADRPTQG
jgi:4-hydroxybenzoyl-CoA reductase subunit beta